MQKFEITLKNEKLKLYNQLSWIFIAIHIILFLYFSLFSTDKNTRGWSISILVLLGFCFLLRYYFKRIKRQLGLHPFFLFLMIGWFSMEQYWPAVVVFIFDILSAITTRKLIAVFSEEEVTYPAFPLKIIRWEELNNAIIKDGLLTIDFKNNRFIQQSIDETTVFINEKEFNEFCNQRLRSATVL